ncbi:MAG: phosphoribosyltransferase, partial [Burkholderiales bacterium]|nr:phosphoribosyltransferase [Burkholderiales bacterium]
MVFSDRIDAGRRLAEALATWRGRRPLVCAIPRGAVPMGKVVADALGGDLDVVLTRKIPAPGFPEFAIGAVDESGWSYVSDDAARVGATRDYLDRAIAAERETMRRRREQYTP